MKLSGAKRSTCVRAVSESFTTRLQWSKKNRPDPNYTVLLVGRSIKSLQLQLHWSWRFADRRMPNSDQEWLLMVDGAARGNPGEAGCGVAICDEQGVVVEELTRYLGHATNNVAEYQALLIGLEALLRLNRKRVRVQSDSQLLVRQLNGEYRVKDEKLRTLSQRALSLLRQFKSYRIVHVPREQNKIADRLANKAIDDALKRVSAG